MNKAKRDYTVYLKDMIESITWIFQFTEDISFDEFNSDRKTVDAVIRNFEIIGEASKSVPSEIKKRFEEIPWNEMYLMRNKISHEYFGVDLELVWHIIRNDLPDNLMQLKKILESDRLN